MSVNQILNVTDTFHYTKTMLPNSQDSTLKKVAKVVLIILSLGSVFIVTFKIDLIRKVAQYFVVKNQEKPKPQTLLEKVSCFAKKFWTDIQNYIPCKNPRLAAGYIALTCSTFYLIHRSSDYLSSNPGFTISLTSAALSGVIAFF